MYLSTRARTSRRSAGSIGTQKVGLCEDISQAHKKGIGLYRMARACRHYIAHNFLSWHSHKRASEFVGSSSDRVSNSWDNCSSAPKLWGLEPLRKGPAISSISGFKFYAFYDEPSSPLRSPITYK